LAEVAVSWCLQVNGRRQQKDSFIQLLAPTASSALSGGKKIPAELVNVVCVAAQLEDAGAWRKGGGGNRHPSARQGFLQQLELLLL